mmetsp:Transcript_1358/g.3167  ORF Transcript_1358/g.3167 Transcript_1358/m.3167 type:complete len:201 (-) Transcript_1358:5-607(-)
MTKPWTTGKCSRTIPLNRSHRQQTLYLSGTSLSPGPSAIYRQLTAQRLHTCAAPWRPAARLPACVSSPLFGTHQSQSPTPSPPLAQYVQPPSRSLPPAPLEALPPSWRDSLASRADRSSCQLPRWRFAARAGSQTSPTRHRHHPCGIHPSRRWRPPGSQPTARVAPPMPSGTACGAPPAGATPPASSGLLQSRCHRSTRG